MLVKELRQGLKTNVFVGVFVTVQVAMILLVGFRLLTIGAEDASGAGEWMDGVLWFSLGTMLLLIMPVRGLNSISEETKQNTLDLVQLTHLGAMRIVTGKWIALIGQILLLTMAVLPYAVLRYFFGGVDVVSNLTTLLGMLLASAVVSACCVMMSTMPAVMRTLLLCLMFFMFFGGGFGLMVRFSMGGPAPGGAPFSLVAALVSAALATWFLLALAASRIASAAENYASLLRVIALATVSVALIARVLFHSRSDMWIGVSWAIGALAIFEALTEGTHEQPGIYAPWVRRGGVVRMLGRIFYPGWATGLFFTAVMVGAFFSLVLATEPRSARDEILTMAPFAYLAAIFPVPLVLLVRWVKQPGWVYMLVHAVGLILYAAARMIEALPGKHDLLEAVIDSLTPTTAVLSMTGGWLGKPNDMHWVTVPVIGLSVGAAAFVWLLVSARKEFRRIRELETISLATRREPTVP